MSAERKPFMVIQTWWEYLLLCAFIVAVSEGAIWLFRHIAWKP